MTTDGHAVFGPGDVAAGQDVWRSFGGMELGSIWGHGAYVARTGPPTGSTAS